MRTINHRSALLLISVIATLVSSGCAKKAKIAKPPKLGHTESGIASWYGHPYHGRRAANGEVYDMEKLTAAHRTYPFNTWVRVKNLSNDRTVDVRIQDRGPFIRGRIIDLSKAAAREIELLGPGVTKVRLTVIAPPKNVEQLSATHGEVRQVDTKQAESKQVEANQAQVKQLELFGIQVGAFRDRSRAFALRDEMQSLYGSARVIERGADPPMYRVVAGAYETTEQAEAAAERVRSRGGVALVVRLDEPASTPAPNVP